MTSGLKETIHILKEMDNTETTKNRPKSAKPRRKKGQDKVNASNHEDEDIEKSDEYEDGAGTRIGGKKRNMKPHQREQHLRSPRLVRPGRRTTAMSRVVSEVIVSIIVFGANCRVA